MWQYKWYTAVHCGRNLQLIISGQGRSYRLWNEGIAHELLSLAWRLHRPLGREIFHHEPWQDGHPKLGNWPDFSSLARRQKLHHLYLQQQFFCAQHELSLFPCNHKRGFKFHGKPLLEYRSGRTARVESSEGPLLWRFSFLSQKQNKCILAGPGDNFGGCINYKLSHKVSRPL